MFLSCLSLNINKNNNGIRRKQLHGCLVTFDEYRRRLRRDPNELAALNARQHRLIQLY